jgi:HAD superfamily hydrolase (TIGR01509 family)
MSPALVIFDLDGVLVDSEHLAARAVAEEAADWGSTVGAAEVLARFVGLTDKRIGEVLSAEASGQLPADFAERVHLRALALIDRELEPVPGARQVLERLALPRCVASNSRPDRVARSLAATGLSALFADDALFSAAQVARPKPAPDLHRHAAARMGIQVGDAVVIEDSETGVTAAVAAGMTVLGFLGAGHITDRDGHGARLTAAGASLVFDELRALPDLLNETSARSWARPSGTTT